jgi:nucleoside-diphosphate-sugar epimerase
MTPTRANTSAAPAQRPAQAPAKVTAEAPPEEPPDQARRPPRRPRLGRPRLLIVGCGDIGLRIVARLRDRFRILATVTGAAGTAALRTAGAVPLLLDLDTTARNARLRALAPRVLALFPTSPAGRRDLRAPRLLRVLGPRPQRPWRERRRRAARSALVYVSTTGVYGDRRGAWTDESTPARPSNERAQRRLDAETRLRASAWRATVLRVPGIYGPDRLPLERLRQAIPVPPADQDVFTNHIHADDLARACIAALFRAAPARVYNTVDDSQLLLGQYLDRVADRVGLPRPARAPWETVRAAAGPQRMSFMSESRRLRNARMKRELRVKLLYPDVDAGLAALLPGPRD